MKLTYADFDARIFPVTESGCWIWMAGLHHTGYGIFGDKLAHIVSYKRHKGSVPKGLELDHLCRVRCCVNPDHLEAVTRRENMRRSPLWTGNRSACKNGHEFTTENTYFSKKQRNCRACGRVSSMRYRQKRGNT